MRQLTVLLEGMTHTEGARWHNNRFWFSDLYSERVCSMREDGTELRTEMAVPQRPSGIGWLPDGRLLAVSMRDRKLLRREQDGSVVTHADLFAHLEFEPNDMIVDARGRAWVGNLGFDIMKLAPRRPGRLARVDPDGSVTMVSDPLHFPNGSTIIENRTLVVAESFGNRLSAFDIQADGSLSARRDWASFGPVSQSDEVIQSMAEIAVAADGISQIDAEGAIWVADFTKARVLRVAAGGRILEEIPTADRNCYACALGGADGRTLFLCVTPADFNPDVRRANPLSAVLSVQVDVPRA